MPYRIERREIVSGFFHTDVSRGQQRPWFLKTNNMKEKNDCYKCPHRREVPGSAHSECALGEPLTLQFILRYAGGQVPTQHQDEQGNVLLKFDPVGVRNGWCLWPFNFDPTWVECYLPIEKDI
jgi:hypothetical protein